jgi:hypothetical protein
MRTSIWIASAALALASLAVACGGSDESGVGGAGASTGAGESTGPGAGPPAPTCPAPLTPVDTSHADAVVGDGTAASCDEHALGAALAQGGTVTFDCGGAPVTIAVTAQQEVATDTVIDGGGLVTLDGGGQTRILHLASAWDQVGPKLTVQNLSLMNGYTTDDPDTHDTDQGGAAIYREGGSLDVIDCQFAHNHAAQSGQDVSGGAINAQGVGPTTIVGTKFWDNSASNGGGVGIQSHDLTIVNSSFDQNAATGTDGNPGNGGDGGAISFDGAMTSFVICGSTFTNNTSGAQGGALFRVAYTDEPTTIDKCTFDSNESDTSVGLAGAIYLEYTAITMTATTISNNRAHYGGGFWIGHHAIADITNVTIANNTADQGGGVWVSDEVTGLLLNVTLANNVDTEGGYAPGWFGGDANLQFQNCVVSGGGCEDDPLGSAGVNIQFPDSGEPCFPSATTADPKLGALMDNGGPTETMMPGAGSAALGVGSGCPSTDQRGNARSTASCTLGAVEAD